MLRQDKADMEHPARRAPSDGGECPHLAKEMRHHVEVIDVLGDKGGVRLDINQGKVFVAGMGQYDLLARLERMGGIRPHPIL